MNTASSANNPPDSGHSAQGMSTRKTQHLDICRDQKRTVEGGNSRFSEVRLLHHALSEVDAKTIDTSCEFLGYKVAVPLFISSMTGGSDSGYGVNKQLAKLAQEFRIPVGMGSIRILFRKPEVFEHFTLKNLAADVPVVANLGAVQIRDMVHGQIIEMLKRLEVDALAIHLNPGQELFQNEGDRDFHGIFDAIRRFCANCPLPVIVKETGCGIAPHEAIKLLKIGVRYVNIAGSGGTNWISVEKERYLEEQNQIAQVMAANEFADWGNPTALVLAVLRQLEDKGRIPGSTVPQPLHLLLDEAREKAKGRHKSSVAVPATYDGMLSGRILASGGIRTGMDAVKALVLGARMVGTALPIVRALHSGGMEAAQNYLHSLVYALRSAMVLQGCRNLSDLRKAAYFLSPSLSHEVNAWEQLIG